MRRAAKIDANQPAIVEALRGYGVSVQILSMVGDGCVDLLLGYKRVNYLVELKDGDLPPSERLLTPAQKRWHAEWKGVAHVANSLSDVLLILGITPPFSEARKAA